jgi:hypothetical protein
MVIAKTYDKVSWHFPEGKGCPSLAAAKIHFQVVTEWLKDKGLLSAEGIEAVDAGIDSDFALTAHMLTTKGNRILGRCYSDWVRAVIYGQRPSVALLDKSLKEEK